MYLQIYKTIFVCINLQVFLRGTYNFIQFKANETSDKSSCGGDGRNNSEEEEKLSELVNKYVSKITITSSFTRDERTTKRKVVTYQWVYEKDGNTYVSDGWKINVN